MCFFFKKKNIKHEMEFEMDCTQHGAVYKRTYQQWRIKHDIK